MLAKYSMDIPSVKHCMFGSTGTEQFIQIPEIEKILKSGPLLVSSFPDEWFDTRILYLYWYFKNLK